MARVILMNGAPRAGKDTAAKIITRYMGSLGCETIQANFKTELVKLTAALLGLTVDEFLVDYDKRLPDGSWHKDKPQFIFRGDLISQRQALIHTSENVIKPVFGNDVFGKLEAAKIDQNTDHVHVFSDSGFDEELTPIIEKVGFKNLFLFRIHCDGCDFKGDSRKHLKLPPHPLVNQCDIYNDGTLPEFEDSIVSNMISMIERINQVVGERHV